MDWQAWTALAIAGACAAWVLHSQFRILTGKRGGGCGTCAPPSSESGCGSCVVQQLREEGASLPPRR